MKVACKELDDFFYMNDDDFFKKYVKQVAESVTSGKHEKEYNVSKACFYLLRYMNEVFAYVEDNIECDWRSFNRWLRKNGHTLPEAFEEKLLTLSRNSLIYSGKL